MLISLKYVKSNTFGLVVLVKSLVHVFVFGLIFLIPQHLLSRPIQQQFMLFENYFAE